MTMDLRHLPKRITDLKSVPEPYRIAYLDDEERGGFFLDIRIAKVVLHGESIIAHLKNEIRQVAKQREAFEAKRVSRISHEQLQAEVRAAGVNPKMANAVAALISENAEFEVEDAGGGEIVIARTSVGMKSLGALVNDFLLSDDGVDFRPQTTVPQGDYFATMVAGLKLAK